MRLLGTLALATSLWCSRAEAAPSVVVTIKPIHSLVAAVMEGIGKPELLVSGAEDEHTYALRPSDAGLLSKANLIVWVGPYLEGFMKRPLETLGSHARNLQLMSLSRLTLLKLRKGGVWEPDEDEAEHVTSTGDGNDAVYNAHIWLDPKNAETIVGAVTKALTEVDPTHAQIYADNAEQTVQRLRKLDDDLRLKLAPVRDQPFIVFHDAYQYFERRYHLNAVGSITAVPQAQPGAERVREIKTKIRTLDAVCVFSEPQFEPRLVSTLIEGASARHGALDAIGAALEPGPELYFTLLDNLADDLRACLLKGG